MNRIISEEERTEYGVPQGSILGPLFFIIFINDLPDHLLDCRTHIYVDDTAISVSGSSPAELEFKLNVNPQAANNWMVTNHLTLNCAKTKAMFFGTTHTLGVLDRTPPSVCLGNKVIEAVEEFKYLGIILDRKLTFSNHVEYLTRKGVSRLKMLGRTRKYLSKNSSLLLYKTLMA